MAQMGTDTQQQRSRVRGQGSETRRVYFATDARGERTLLWRPGRDGFLFEVTRREVATCKEVWTVEGYLRLLLERCAKAVPVAGRVIG